MAFRNISKLDFGCITHVVYTVMGSAKKPTYVSRMLPWPRFLAIIKSRTRLKRVRSNIPGHHKSIGRCTTGRTPWAWTKQGSEVQWTCAGADYACVHRR
jgi:hypothetical protein